MKRRNLLIGLGALAAAAGAAMVALKPFGRRYPATPYDDLLNRLDDREWAAKFGAAALAAMPGFTPAAGATRLRVQMGPDTLRTVARRDAEAGRLQEVGGWLVPESVALMAALARSVTP